ncbi:MAG: DUF4236 domain-containing protein [Bacteroidota bacterium]|nr:DUF4236 domain-containing protein [Bacteroidota bacterium]
MRFRRKVKIMKGLSLNLSKSGVSVSAGVRGASVTIGKKGTYLNTGIPGTGIYDRKRIGGSNSSQQQQQQLRNTGTQTQDLQAKVSIGLDDKGKPTLAITDSYGRQITDEKILRSVKRSDKYKESVNGLIEQKKVEVDEETSKFISISKFTPVIVSKVNIQDAIESLSPEIHNSLSFQIERPTKDKIAMELGNEAKQKIRSIFFWKNNGLRDAFISENLESRFQRKVEEWKIARDEFIENEHVIKAAKDKEYYDNYIAEKNEFDSILKGDTNYINERIEIILSEISLPAEFSVNYEYNLDIKQLKIDLDLPEIEDIPQEKANILSSGKISIKQKTQKELKQEYAQCVSGIALYLGGTFFNISTTIAEIIISGFAQRLNKATGNIEDQYIYSIKLTRDKFSELKFERIDPVEAFSNFENIRSLSANYDFKIIVPW